MIFICNCLCKFVLLWSNLCCQYWVLNRSVHFARRRDCRIEEMKLQE